MITENSEDDGKISSNEIKSMLFELIKSCSDRTYENEIEYKSLNDN